MKLHALSAAFPRRQKYDIKTVDLFFNFFNTATTTLIFFCVYIINFSPYVDSVKNITGVDFSTSPSYVERDKATHRANRAHSLYDPDNAIYKEFTVNSFVGGLHFPANTFLNFEDWKAGSYPLSYDGDIRRREGQHSSHFNSFNFSHSGDLNLYLTEHLTFNTTSATATLVNGSAANIVYNGFVRYTPSGTRLTVYNFLSIHFGESVNITVVGDFPIVILSRSSIVIDTSIVIKSGTLGGFLGCSGLPTTQRDSGYGSNPVRLYTHTVTVNATDIDEIQQVVTSGTQGQNLGGGFTLSYKGDMTRIIRHNALPQYVGKILETDLTRLGKVRVTRNFRDNEGGFTWNITFISSIGDAEEMVVTNNLTGVGSNVVYRTLRDGNTLGGQFKLNFLNSTTRNIQFNETAGSLQQILKEDIPDLVDTWVARTDPTAKFDHDGDYVGACEARDGSMCASMAEKSGGFKWIITTTTLVGVVGRTEPVSAYPTTPNVDVMTISNTLTGLGANAYIVTGHEFINEGSLKGGPATPYVIHMGGTGASYVKPGGAGHANTTASPTYVVESNDDLRGGSGGGCGGELPLSGMRNGFLSPGLGGNGGGVIEISAVNDFTIGPKAVLSTNGQDGTNAFEAGGGGSGGTIALHAGGSIRLDGTIHSNGGHGGLAVGTTGGAVLSVPGGGGSGGKIILDATAVYRGPLASTTVYGGKGNKGEHYVNINDAKYNNDEKIYNAADGTIYETTKLKFHYYIDVTQGAFETKRSLVLGGKHSSYNTAGYEVDQPMAKTGVIYSFKYDYPNGIQPMRVTYFMKFGAYGSGSDVNNIGSYFAIHPPPELVDASFTPGPMEDSSRADGITQSGGEVLIGIAVVNGHLHHAANFDTLPGVAMDSKDSLVMEFIEHDRWYKIDVLISWVNQTYVIRVDDNVRIIDHKFRGQKIEKLGFYNYNQVTTWYDEIFVGRDFTANFRCPISFADPETKMGTELFMNRPFETGWGVQELDDSIHGRTNSFFPTDQHTSHLKRRNRFRAEYEYGGVLPRSGPMHKLFRTDITTFSPDGDKDIIMGTVDFSVLMFDAFNRNEISETTKDSSQTTGKGGTWIKPEGAGSTGRYYWFGEHHGISSQSFLNGSISACSTSDFVTWRNEGTVLHFSNITDDETGLGNEDLIIERPKVLFNPKTKKYVMWMHLDDKKETVGTRGLAAVAISDYPNGPYAFVRSFKPDNNETHDMTVIQDANGVAHLARTYYATTSYYLPEPVMQPMWESVKFRNGTCNYGLNYHRAFYHEGYDDNDDICNQRLRKEDKPYEYVKPSRECMEQPDFLPKLSADQIGSIPPHMFNRKDVDGNDCKPQTYGMGPPYFPGHEIEDPIRSRFKYPNKTDNNFWMPSSVPTVKPQPWVENYEDGNINDNPPHETLSDQLIGPTQLVHMRRAKYVAISRLTDDYLDITTWMNIIEGEASDMDSLAKIVDVKNYLGWAAFDANGSSTEPVSVWGSDTDQEMYIGRTRGLTERLTLSRYTEATGFDKPSFAEVEPDWFNRHWQYTTYFNDRVDSPVNFKDQLDGRRQWQGRQGPNTLVDRADRDPLDRNCFRSTGVPEPWMNQPFTEGRMYRYRGSWNIHTSRGGPEGSSLTYDFGSELVLRQNFSVDPGLALNGYHEISHPDRTVYGNGAGLNVNNDDRVWKNKYGFMVRDEQNRMIRGSGPWTYSVGEDDPWKLPVGAACTQSVDCRSRKCDFGKCIEYYEGYDGNHFIDPRWTYEKGLDGYIKEEEEVAKMANPPHPKRQKGGDPTDSTLGCEQRDDDQWYDHLDRLCTPLPYEYYVEYFETEKDIYIPYGDAPFTWDASQLKELPCEVSIEYEIPGDNTSRKLREYCERTQTTVAPEYCKDGDIRPMCCVGCETVSPDGSDATNGIDVKDYTLSGGPPKHAHTQYTTTGGNKKHLYNEPNVGLGGNEIRFKSNTSYPRGPYVFFDEDPENSPRNMDKTYFNSQ